MKHFDMGALKIISPDSQKVLHANFDDQTTISWNLDIIFEINLFELASFNTELKINYSACFKSD